MKIVKFQGGLGNQLFQYAFYKNLKLKYKNVKADISEYKTDYSYHYGFELNKIFKLEEFEIATFKDLIFMKNNILYFFPFFGKKIYNLFFKNKKNRLTKNDSDFKSFSEYFKYSENDKVYYDGFFIFEENLEKVKNELLKELEIKNINNINKEYLKRINPNDTFIHVRRGDYLNEIGYRNICTTRYYQEAIKYLKYKNGNFYIFSDDIEWCKKNIKGDNIEYIDINKGKNSYLDLYLMLNFTNAIIANSTFSWWGANLKENIGVIIQPSKYNLLLEKNLLSIKNSIKINEIGKVMGKESENE